jgi:hypothetical protein
MATKTITLPSGATVVLKDPTTLRVKDRKKVYRNANGEEGIMQAISLIDGLIAIMVESWSLDLIIPSIKIESIDEMEMADYDALTEEAQIAQKTLFPSLAKTDEAEADPKVPTANSKD